MRFNFTLILLTMFNIQSYADTILIPDDAPSLQEAVEMAVSGDEIRITKSEFNLTLGDSLGVVIDNKDLKIVGVNPKELSKTKDETFFANLNENSHTLLVKDSSIILENIHIHKPLYARLGPEAGPNPSPIVFQNADAIIQNCTINGFIEFKGNLTLKDSVISGYSWFHQVPYYGGSLLNPSLTIGPSANSIIKIINSTITADSDKGFNNVVIDGLVDSEIIFENSNLIGGTYDIYFGSNPGYWITGSDAVRFTGCENVNIFLISSHFEGGNGYHGAYHRSGNFQGGGDGGNALSIINSKMKLVKDNTTSIFEGGNGGDGLVGTNLPIHPRYEPIIHAGNGGDAISVIQSNIEMNYYFVGELELISGQGGEGNEYEDDIALPGGMGKKINIDTLTEINYLTSINDWMLMQ